MVEFEAVRYWTLGFLVVDAVGQLPFFAPRLLLRHVAVTRRVFAPLPDPTRGVVSAIFRNVIRSFGLVAILRLVSCDVAQGASLDVALPGVRLLRNRGRAAASAHAKTVGVRPRSVSEGLAPMVAVNEPPGDTGDVAVSGVVVRTYRGFFAAPALTKAFGYSSDVNTSSVLAALRGLQPAGAFPIPKPNYTASAVL